jgi:hypothetical protein
MTEVKTKYKKLVCKTGYKVYRDGFIPMEVGMNDTTITEIGDEELHKALMDFINISLEIDNGADPHETIFAFMNEWGSLHDLETIEPDVPLTRNPVFPNMRVYLTVDDWYDRSNWNREVLTELKRGKNKSAREQFLKRDWSLLDRFYEDDPLLTPYDVPKNLEEALHVTLRQAFFDHRPLRVCHVCGKLFQRAITAKQCSRKCTSHKSVRKFRSKK